MRGSRSVALLFGLALGLVASVSLAQSEALSSDTVGSSPQTVAVPGSFAFSVDGDVSLGGFVFKDGYSFIHNDGGPSGYNTAVGLDALVSSNPGVPYPPFGTYNTAFGAQALQFNTSGVGNMASGAQALRDNTTGILNTASGTVALQTNTTGYWNSASGAGALQYNTTGFKNTASGARALRNNTTGARNIGVGYTAGLDNYAGSDNIWIASQGVYTDSNTLRIGSGTGTGYFQQNRAFISGIRGVTTGSADAIAVLIDSSGQLGTVSSSRRVKQDIHDMGEASSGLQKLRPVTFRYKKPFADGSKPIRYGLIAEEVAEVFPELVVYDEQGRPQTVMYHLLDAMLINEIQKQQRTIEGQAAELAELRGMREEIEVLRADRARLDEVIARLARLEAVQREQEGAAVVAQR